MITISEITEAINTGLNAVASANKLGFEFYVQSEGGEYIPPKRKGNTVTPYVNGITRIIDSSIIPTQGVKVITEIVGLNIAFPLPDDGGDAITQAIAAVRTVLDSYFTQTPIGKFTDENGKAMLASLYADIPTTEKINLTTGLGLNCKFDCTLYYNYIENGVNSFDFVMFFNGALIPYTNATVSRVPVMESVPYSDTSGVSEALTNLTAINVEFSAPTIKAADNALFAAYKNYLLTGDNSTANTLTIQYEDSQSTYKVVFGQSSVAFEGIKNGNSQIALVEAREL